MFHVVLHRVQAPPHVSSCSLFWLLLCTILLYTRERRATSLLIGFLLFYLNSYGSLCPQRAPTPRQSTAAALSSCWPAGCVVGARCYLPNAAVFHQVVSFHQVVPAVFPCIWRFVLSIALAVQGVLLCTRTHSPFIYIYYRQCWLRRKPKEVPRYNKERPLMRFNPVLQTEISSQK